MDVKTAVTAFVTGLVAILGIFHVIISPELVSIAISILTVLFMIFASRQLQNLKRGNFK
jgi:hypothetical protein